MKPSDHDFKDLTEILETFEKNLPKMKPADLIDLAARLKPIAKHCESIDKFVKAEVKSTLAEKPGELFGNMFKAVLKLVPYKRLNQADLKAAHPRICSQFTDEGEEPRISFELR